MPVAASGEKSKTVIEAGSIRRVRRGAEKDWLFVELKSPETSIQNVVQRLLMTHTMAMQGPLIGLPASLPNSEA